jgi:histidinol phosphatase-like PHP family hydrolase
MFREAGLPITLASDAHVVRDAGFGRQQVVEAARAAGYTHHLRFERRRRTEVPLPAPAR